MPRRGGEEARPVANRMIFTSPAVRTFLASFLVLFLEIALIRWMPAYIRLLAYFSNFILLASFLGIGVGCLLTSARARLFMFFPALLAAVVAAVYFLRLEVAVQTAGSIYFSSGTADQVVVVESTMLLPLLFIIIAALFATLAQRMGREMAVLPPLNGYTVNIVGSLGGGEPLRADLMARTVAGCLVRHRARCRAAPHRVARAGTACATPAAGAPERHPSLRVAGAGSRHGAWGAVVSVLQDHGWTRRTGYRCRGEQHLSPVDGAGGPQGIFLSVAVRRFWRHASRTC